MIPNKSGLRLAWFGFYLCIFGFFLFTYLFFRDFKNDIFKWLVTLGGMAYGVILFYILAKYTSKLPKWAKFFVPEFVVKDFKERFLTSNKKDLKWEIKGTVLTCIVNAFGGVGYALDGFDGFVLMGFLGVFCAWQINKIWKTPR